VKELFPADRPREKLARHGAAALGDNELVAIVLGSGDRRAGALALASALLVARGGLHGLVRSTCDELKDVAGIGPARASQILAAIELGRRTLAHAPTARVRIRSPREAAAYLMPTFGSLASEQFGIVLLDSKHRVIRTTVIALGTLNSTVVEPRDVFREAAVGRAAAIVVFHNHPSGDPTPSGADVELTRRLVAAGALMGIEVVDHLVLADVRYCSFKEMGRL
jgi:DNA repair protein RadC